MIQLDLKTALPKIREALDTGQILPGTGRCRYSAPCAIGAALTPEQVQELVDAHRDSAAIDNLISYGAVEVPDGQARDFLRLQITFDGSPPEEFERVLARLEHQYGVGGDA